jgi:UDP-N-acetylmuramoyl-tripeptide--D-alanyl-D-alanine ligase
MTFKTVTDVAGAIDGSRIAGDASIPVKGFSTDSRSIQPGDVFIALRGENFDGHDYIDEVLAKGAAAAVVSNDWLLERDETVRGALIAVRDPLAAYGEIARAHRRTFSCPMVAVAGSNGKTTTKELIGAVLSNVFEVHKTTGNLNNLIGVPATILKMTPQHSAGVIEIGTNTPGEIEKLCAILEPTHGIITNIGREHLELLGSIEGVAEEEGALFGYLDANGGTAFVNIDDPQLVRISETLKRKVTYSIRSAADLVANVERLSEGGAPILAIDDKRGESTPIALKLPGMHNATNAVAAAAVGLAFGVTRDQLKLTLESFEPLPYSTGYARLAPVRAKNGALILNDTYNANPDSMFVAFDTLRAMPLPHGGRKIVILGEMRELGASSAEEHSNLGQEIAASGGIDAAYLFGAEMKHANDSLERVKFATAHYVDKAPLIERVLADITANDIVLVKGSRGTKMEEVVAALVK